MRARHIHGYWITCNRNCCAHIVVVLEFLRSGVDFDGGNFFATPAHGLKRRIIITDLEPAALEILTLVQRRLTVTVILYKTLNTNERVKSTNTANTGDGVNVTIVVMLVDLLHISPVWRKADVQFGSCCFHSRLDSKDNLPSPTRTVVPGTPGTRTLPT